VSFAAVDPSSRWPAGRLQRGGIRAAPYSPCRPYGRLLRFGDHEATDRAYFAPPDVLSRTRLDGTVSRAGVTIRSPCAHLQVSHGTGTARHHREQVGHFPSAVGSCLASNPVPHITRQLYARNARDHPVIRVIKRFSTPPEPLIDSLTVILETTMIISSHRYPTRSGPPGNQGLSRWSVAQSTDEGRGPPRRGPGAWRE
jgi:hypothetical protein